MYLLLPEFGHFHELQHFVFASGDSLLQRIDLHQHSGILFIGLDLEELALGFLQIILLLGDLRFKLASLLIDVFQLFAVLGDGGLRFIQGAREGVEFAGFGLDGLFKAFNCHLQLLQRHK
ncbi:MAG TPA: hypothetical protein VNP04_02220 [Alphaproteobacteria bacterium]|nr:hypothetical protein [Alphaproteobacteria bacterium]